MSLLPEQQCADHISHLLDAANEAGLPVFWRSITPEQASRYFLNSLSLQDVLQMDHNTVDQSISLWNSEPDGGTWGPWWMTKFVVNRKQADWENTKADERKAAADSPIKPKMVQTDEQKDQAAATEMMDKASMAEKLKMVQWAIRETGRESIGIGFFAAYLTRVKHDREMRK